MGLSSPNFLPRAFVALLFLPLAHGLGLPALAAERPNVLWITSEDNSPYLGCYGDSQAHTPHLDKLAAEGVRYRNAFANAPVCSTARTTLITGMYACSLGAHHHRSRVATPAGFKLYPEHLRTAGYYCTNNSKTDYNLADVPEQANRLNEMRRVLRDEMISIRDTGFIPEGMLTRLSAGRTPYDYARSDEYPIKRIVALADRATSRDADALGELVEALADPHPVIRYWGATGCLILQKDALPAKARLLAALNDDWADVRIATAEALGYLGESEAGLKALDGVLHEGNQYEVLAALNALDFMHQAGHVPLARVRAMVKGLEVGEPGSRIPDYLLNLQ